MTAMDDADVEVAVRPIPLRSWALNARCCQKFLAGLGRISWTLIQFERTPRNGGPVPKASYAVCARPIAPPADGAANSAEGTRIHAYEPFERYWHDGNSMCEKKCSVVDGF